MNPTQAINPNQMDSRLMTTPHSLYLVYSYARPFQPLFQCIPAAFNNSAHYFQNKHLFTNYPQFVPYAFFPQSQKLCLFPSYLIPSNCHLFPNQFCNQFMNCQCSQKSQPVSELPIVLTSPEQLERVVTVDNTEIIQEKKFQEASNFLRLSSEKECINANKECINFKQSETFLNELEPNLNQENLPESNLKTQDTQYNLSNLFSLSITELDKTREQLVN